MEIHGYVGETKGNTLNWKCGARLFNTIIFKCHLNVLNLFSKRFAFLIWLSY